MIARLVAQVWYYLKSRDVPLGYKLLYIGSVAAYTIAIIDFMPFLPFDDILVAWLASRLFVYFAREQESLKRQSTFDDGKVIDIKARVVDEE